MFGERACSRSVHAGESASREVAGVIAPPPLIYLSGLVVGVGINALLPALSVPATVAGVLGGLLVAAAAVLATSFVVAFRCARTPVDPGKPTTALITTGPYRLTRNPGYLAMALASAGIVLLTGTLWAFVTFPATLVLIDRGVIAREERYLVRRFGDEYRRYLARSRRWL